jgi:voltage-gated potassium channel
MSHPFRRLLPAVMLLAVVIFTGITGYILIENYSLLQAAYMVVTTLFAVGYQEVMPLSSAGRIFTMCIIISGVGTVIYAAGQAFEIIVEGEMTGYRRRKRMGKKISEVKNHYIICGFGRVGHQVAEVFDASRTAYVVIDSKKETLDELDLKNIPSIIGDATSDSILREAGIETAKGLVACSDSDVANVFVTLSARVLNPNLFIVARASYKDNERKLIMAGANRVISPYFISGVRMASLVTHPVASDFMDMVTHGGRVDFRLYEIRIPKGSKLIDKSIQEAHIRESSGTLVLAIKKADGTFDMQPRASTKMERGDVLVVIGTQEQFESLEKIVGLSR